MPVKKALLGFAITLIASGILLMWRGINEGASQDTSSTPSIGSTQPTPATSSAVLGAESEEVMVLKVVDGDTFSIAGGERVRMIGIDTPETVDPRRAVGCFGKEASNETKKLIEGKNVFLSKDVSDKDSFGRLLRYVYLKNENNQLIFINEYLVRNGYARVATFPPDVKFQELFLQAEKEAREERVGLWEKC